MPKAERMRLAGRPSLTARIKGMPPATAASNPSMTRLRRASSKISTPWWARSALFAVTTCLPDASAFRMNVRAGSRPPTSSITICTSGSSSTGLASLTSGRPLRSSPSRGRVRSASATRWSTSRQPARSCISVPWLSSTLTTPAPTVPSPRRAILISFIASKLGGGLHPPSAASPQEPLRRQSRRSNVDQGARVFRRRPPRRVADQPPFERRLRRRNPVLGEVSEGAVEAPPILSRGEALEAAQGLFDALLVLDQGEADIALAVLAEADAGRDRHLALLDLHLGELERAHDPVVVWDGRPDEHGGLGLDHRPPELVEPVHEDVAPLPVHLHDVVDTGLVAFQRDDPRDLDGLEHAVVEV